jgi:hypothetical protein
MVIIEQIKHFLYVGLTFIAVIGLIIFVLAIASAMLSAGRR